MLQTFRFTEAVCSGGIPVLVTSSQVPPLQAPRKAETRHAACDGSPIWLWVKTNGTISGVFGAPSIFKSILVGIGMFTGGAGF